MIINGVYGAIEVVDVDWRELVKDLDSQILEARKQIQDLNRVLTLA